MAAVAGGAEHLHTPSGKITFRSRRPLATSTSSPCRACSLEHGQPSALVLCSRCFEDINLVYAAPIRIEQVIQRIAIAVREALGQGKVSEDFRASVDRVRGTNA